MAVFLLHREKDSTGLRAQLALYTFRYTSHGYTSSCSVEIVAAVLYTTLAVEMTGIGGMLRMFPVVNHPGIPNHVEPINPGIFKGHLSGIVVLVADTVLEHLVAFVLQHRLAERNG